MDEAARCDRLVLMRQARILADGEPDELLRRTDRDDMEQAFLRLVDDAARVAA